MKTLLVCLGVAGVACAGCNAPAPRLNAPPHGVAETTSELQGTFVQMTDNALLADMSISDVHFVPHRAMLNTLGEQRLSRLAALMEVYGGELRFSTDLEDEALFRARTQTVAAFLCDAGIDTTAEVIHRDLPGGGGMEAREVILIKTHEGTYKPKQSKSELPAGTAGAGQD